MNYKKNLKEYVSYLPLTALIIFLIQYIAYYYLYNNSQGQALERSLIFALVFFIFSLIIARFTGIKFSFKDMKCKKITIILLIIIILINIFHFI